MENAMLLHKYVNWLNLFRNIFLMVLIFKLIITFKPAIQFIEIYSTDVLNKVAGLFIKEFS